MYGEFLQMMSFCKYLNIATELYGEFSVDLMKIDEIKVIIGTNALLLKLKMLKHLPGVSNLGDF
jgi:hypothetical protein